MSVPTWTCPKRQSSQNNELCHSQAPFVVLWGETGASDGIRFCSPQYCLYYDSAAETEPPGSCCAAESMGAGPGESGISSGDTCVESVACAWNQSAICVSLTGCRFHASSPTLRLRGVRPPETAGACDHTADDVRRTAMPDRGNVRHHPASHRQDPHGRGNAID